MRQVAVLDATGAIGQSALDFIRLHPDRYRASVLSSHRHVSALVQQCTLHQPGLAIIEDAALEAELARRLASAGVRCDIASGPHALIHAAASALCNIAVIAISGWTGIEAALAAARTGKHVLLGNLETAAMAGLLLRQAAAESGGRLIPLDPVLQAASRCLSQTPAQHEVRRLTLADAGGPFRGLGRAALMTVTPEQTCKSAEFEWTRRDAVNAASQMRNGQQVIAAHALFDITPDQIETRLHPWGQPHTEVEFADGSLQARRGHSEGHAIFSWALAWPESADAEDRLQPPAKAAVPPPLEKPDLATFRCLSLAYEALRAGGDAPVILNAANAVAVEAFLAGTLPFLSIADLIEQVLTELPPQSVVDIQTLREHHRTAREAARQVLRNAC
ncbi:1-deoxy-D-xylulose-5-phosphate reductoisomerase [Dyella caseinilytica]|uniref:1-deoxy-D-xylulose 5-phosphate reductoisomerase n=1 Tax=Dyella caseinilytica TaxID=1849581 RepID=A0ABX7H054_9GAMM|nr:1-deoxy-D-xylulose-5-phosphate reductoisomerase [Dyella caseinilytica]QRN55934.1 1-deoxy-D-xylulose-5-phosphate reductoisomerase [Dyella caseinilytica]